MKKSTRKARPSKAKTAPRRKATKPPTDTALIHACVRYVQSVAAYHGGFSADSDGNNVHAAASGQMFENRASAALEKIIYMPATTAEGLLSKARIVPALIMNSAGSWDAREEAFFQSFGANVQVFLEHIVEEHWHAECDAERGKVAA
jgi:hypothetical protein